MVYDCTLLYFLLVHHDKDVAFYKMCRFTGIRFNRKTRFYLPCQCIKMHVHYRERLQKTIVCANHLNTIKEYNLDKKMKQNVLERRLQYLIHLLKFLLFC